MENLWKSMENMEHLWEIYRSTIGYGICMGYVWDMKNLWDICGDMGGKVEL